MEGHRKILMVVPVIVTEVVAMAEDGAVAGMVCGIVAVAVAETATVIDAIAVAVAVRVVGDVIVLA